MTSASTRWKPDSEPRSLRRTPRSSGTRSSLLLPGNGPIGLKSRAHCEERHLIRDWLIRPMGPNEIGTVVDLLSTVPAADTRFALRNGLAESNKNSRAGYAAVAEVDGEMVGAAAVIPDHVFPGTMS